jgi:hypothetical protein
MNLTQAAAFLDINSHTLRLALERGETPAEHPLAAGPWIVSRNSLEADASKRLASRVHDRKQASAIQAANQGTLDLSDT